MAKGKKTLIKEIKQINEDELLINGKEYVILEGTTDILSAKTMKISSNGNRILRFDDEQKKARIDVKRDIDIIKITFKDQVRAKLYAKSKDKSKITSDDKKDIINKAPSYIKAREIVSTFSDKKSKSYDANFGKTTFYILEE